MHAQRHMRTGRTAIRKRIHDPEAGIQEQHGGSHDGTWMGLGLVYEYRNRYFLGRLWTAVPKRQKGGGGKGDSIQAREKHRTNPNCDWGTWQSSIFSLYPLRARINDFSELILYPLQARINDFSELIILLLLRKKIWNCRHSKILTAPPRKPHHHPVVLGGFEWFWVVLSGFGWFWVVLSGFERFWVVLSGFEWFWVVLGGFGPRSLIFCVFGHFLTQKMAKVSPKKLGSLFIFFGSKTGPIFHFFGQKNELKKVQNAKMSRFKYIDQWWFSAPNIWFFLFFPSGVVSKLVVFRNAHFFFHIFFFAKFSNCTRGVFMRPEMCNVLTFDIVNFCCCCGCIIFRYFFVQKKFKKNSEKIPGA